MILRSFVGFAAAGDDVVCTWRFHTLCIGEVVEALASITLHVTNVMDFTFLQRTLMSKYERRRTLGLRNGSLALIKRLAISQSVAEGIISVA